MGDGEVEIFVDEVEKMEVCGSWWKKGRKRKEKKERKIKKIII